MNSIDQQQSYHWIYTVHVFDVDNEFSAHLRVIYSRVASALIISEALRSRYRYSTPYDIDSDP